MSGDSDFTGLERFDAVDASGEAEMFARFLEQIESIPEVIARRRRSYELLALGEGDAVADVGCGLGTAARELAETGARVYGFDASEEMIAEARRRAPDAAVEFVVAEAASLPLEKGALHGYRAERVYQHLSDPKSGLEEARRVLGPGGRIVLVDQDWDAFLIDGGDATRSILNAYTDSFRNGRIGRQYRRLLLDAGFENVTVVAETDVITDPYGGTMMSKLAADAALSAGTVPRPDVGAWLEDQRGRIESDRFFAAMAHFIVAGEAA